MKIALVVPGGQKDMGAMGNVSRPPLGVCCLKAYLKKNGYANARIFHQVDETHDEITWKVTAFHPDIVGFSTMSCVFEEGTKLAKKLKGLLPESTIVFGGEHISAIVADEENYGSRLATREFQNHPCIDYMIPFEGEVALLGLVEKLHAGKLGVTIPGVVYYDDLNSKATLSKKIARIQNLDALPIPDRSDLPYDKYHSVDDEVALEYMHTTRGCKYRCSYCATPVSCVGKPVTNSAHRILDEVELVHRKYGRRDFFFCDELFTADYQRIKEFCTGILSRGLDISWRVFARVNDLSGKNQIDIDLMKRAGLLGLFFGVESMNQQTLNRLNKGTTPGQVKLAVERTFRAGIQPWCSMMMGYPWETEAELRKSLNDFLALKNKVQQTYVAFITPFPGTPFYNQCVQNDWIIKPDQVGRTDCSTPVLKTPMDENILVGIYNDFLQELSNG
jgi:radical SAM superfamily enzyme YgiQ (UPF0313 family)